MESHPRLAVCDFGGVLSQEIANGGKGGVSRSGLPT